MLVSISSLPPPLDLIGSGFCETQHSSEMTKNVCTRATLHLRGAMATAHDYHTAKWVLPYNKKDKEVIVECDRSRRGGAVAVKVERWSPFTLAYRSMPRVNEYRKFCLSRVSWQSLETFQFARVGKGYVCWHPWYHTEAKDAAQTSLSVQDRCTTESYPTLDVSDDKAGTQLPMAAKSLLVVPWETFSPLTK